MTTTRATFFMRSSACYRSRAAARRARSRHRALVAGRAAELMPIRRGEMRGRAEAAGDADVGDRHGGLRQQRASALEPPALPQRRGRLAEMTLEQPLELARRQSRLAGDGADAQPLIELALDQTHGGLEPLVRGRGRDRRRQRLALAGAPPALDDELCRNAIGNHVAEACADQSQHEIESRNSAGTGDAGAIDGVEILEQ